jgi:Aminoglycoside adenylyltransferase, C-terminal domain
MSIILDQTPPVARAAWTRLRDEMLAILGDDLVALWGHGGMTAADPSVRHGDLDSYAVLARAPDEATAHSIREAEDRIVHEHGLESDAWYVLADDARRAESPSHASREGRRDTAWAIHRAYWLACRYVHLHGEQPREIVPIPSWAELSVDLQRELEHLERHVFERDDDPYEATYAILNGSRILHAVDTRDVVISKRSAGVWALEHLPGRWHETLRAAGRAYDGHETAEDVQLLAAAMGPFVAMVRERLPAPDERAAGLPPRWSGC